jgi:hypothetical protein
MQFVHGNPRKLIQLTFCALEVYNFNLLPPSLCDHILLRLTFSNDLIK